MLKQAYTTFGILLLLFYSLSWYEGWEFRDPQRFHRPGQVVGLTGSSRGPGSYWYFGNDRSGGFWGGGK